jgi:hypothetical protein
MDRCENDDDDDNNNLLDEAEAEATKGTTKDRDPIHR